MEIDGDQQRRQCVHFPTQFDQSPQPQASFGLIVPGCRLRTDFAPVDPTKFALSLTCPGDIQLPLLSIRELVVFTMPTLIIPPDYGILCYWQVSQARPPQLAGAAAPPVVSTGFELLGAITESQPSARAAAASAISARPP